MKAIGNCKKPLAAAERPSALRDRLGTGGAGLGSLFLFLVSLGCRGVGPTAIRIRLFSGHPSTDRFNISSFEKGFSVLAYEKSGQ